MDLSDLLAWPRRADVPGMLFRRLIARQATRGLFGLTRAEQVLWLVVELCGEVSGDEFFANSAGERAPLVPAALRELGRGELAEVFERSLRHFPRDGRERHEAVASLSAAARAELSALAQQVEQLSDALMLDLVRWIDSHRDEFQLSNAGLAAFRPVTVPPSLGVEAIFELPPDVALPAFYVRASTRPAITSAARSLCLATHAFGEISDEGGVSYLFCGRASHAPEAKLAFEAAGATGAATILGKVMSALPTPYPIDPQRRRDALAALSEDALTKLRALQWELDDLRQPTLAALHGWARRHRASLE